jgi:hypothetical protein
LPLPVRALVAMLVTGRARGLVRRAAGRVLGVKAGASP